MQTKKVLFLCGMYYPNMSANGICILRIRQALYERGIQSDLLCEDGNPEPIEDSYGKIFFLREAEEGSPKSPLVRFFAKLWHAANWPVKTPGEVLAYRRRIREILSHKSYDACIMTLRPINACLAAPKDLYKILYELDSISSNGDNEYGFGRIMKHRALWIERMLYRRADAILHMESYRAHYGKKKYSRYEKKSFWTDIPQLVPPGNSGKKKTDNTESFLRLIYTGVLVRGMRSPEYLLKLLLALRERHSVSLRTDFYSRGNCEELLQKAEQESSGEIKHHGYVPLKEVEKRTEEADFLVSIGNKLPGTVRSLPSKVISYMATGKAILHIHGGENDSALDYLEKYPNALILNPEDPIDENLDRLEQFLRENRGKLLSFEEVEKEFPENRPGYTADLICTILKNRQR